MKAKPGDHIILAAPTVEAPLREGEVVEVRGEDGGPPYVVRWDDGHEGLLYPGPGSVLRVSSATGTGDASTEPAPPAAAPAIPAGRKHVKDWQVRISVFGSDDDAEATVVLVADSPKHLQAKGESHRSEHDRTVPEIGEEVAVARALRRLADQLLDTAAGDIEQVTGEHDVRLRAR
jgi:hypothetical protein